MLRVGLEGQKQGFFFSEGGDSCRNKDTLSSKQGMLVMRQSRLNGEALKDGVSVSWSARGPG